MYEVIQTTGVALWFVVMTLYFAWPFPIARYIWLAAIVVLALVFGYAWLEQRAEDYDREEWYKHNPNELFPPIAERLAKRDAKRAAATARKTAAKQPMPVVPTGQATYPTAVVDYSPAHGNQSREVARSETMDDIAKDLTKFEDMSPRQQRRALADLQRLANTEVQAGQSILQRLGVRKDVILGYDDLLQAQERLNRTINRMNSPQHSNDGSSTPSISAAHQSHALVATEATTLFMQLSADPHNQQRYFRDVRSRYASEPRIADEIIARAQKMLREAGR